MSHHGGGAPLNFDGIQDSLHQEYDTQGRRRLEYVRHRGEFDDLPEADIREAFHHHYPLLIQLVQADFRLDVRDENIN